MWSQPSPDLHPTADPGAAGKLLGGQRGGSPLPRAPLQLPSSAKSGGFFARLIFCVVPLWRFPEKPSSTGTFWERQAASPPLINSPLVSQSRGCFACQVLPSHTTPPRQPEPRLHLNNKSHRGRQAALLPRERGFGWVWGFFFSLLFKLKILPAASKETVSNT